MSPIEDLAHSTGIQQGLVLSQKLVGRARSLVEARQMLNDAIDSSIAVEKENHHGTASITSRIESRTLAMRGRTAHRR